MPLDGHSYLVSQGWGGKGTALREGAISRPITIAQKKNLAGLGKDRDEAFPFWDHLFSAAAKSIQIKYTSDDEDASDSSTTAAVTLKRTSTGILSTRRPVSGTSAASGSATPDSGDQPPPNSGLSLIANAKREAAKRGLYSRFFRGPVIGPEAIQAEENRLAALVSEAFDKEVPSVEKVSITEHIEVETKGNERLVVDLKVSKSVKHKKRSHQDEKTTCDDEEDERRRARKKRRKEEKQKMAEEITTDIASVSAKKDGKKKSRSQSQAKSEDDTETSAIPPGAPTDSLEYDEGEASASQKRDRKRKSKSKSDVKNATIPSDDTRAEDGSSIPNAVEKIKESKEERTRRKEEKRRIKALQKAERQASTGGVEPSTPRVDDQQLSNSPICKGSAKRSRKLEPADNIAAIIEEPVKKKNRKRTSE